MRNADQAAIVFAAFKKLQEATEAFSKGGITSVAHSYERGEALGKGLVALAQYHDVPITEVVKLVVAKGCQFKPPFGRLVPPWFEVCPG